MADLYEEEYLLPYNNEYYDPDEFLAEEQLIPCTFKHIAPNLGPFVAHKDKDIPNDTVVEAPFWLVHALQDEQYVTRGTPKGFLPTVQNGLRACSDNVDVNSLNPHYFKLGKKLAHSEGPRGNETDAAMVEFLAETYQNRLGLVLDKATTHRHLSAEAYSFLATLDASEKQLYYNCQEAYNHMQEWENGRHPLPTIR